MGRMLTLYVAVGVACGLLSAPGRAYAADVMSAADLRDICHSSDTTSRNVCRVYLLGVTEGITLGIEIGRGHGAPACLPEAVSGDALQAKLRERLDAHLERSPGDAQEPAARLIAHLMARAYPCRPIGR
ncbi:MAG: hypothetical protein JOZ67_11925 [Gammaproteobacteria bacterium]|nr:hypothetical protein [Gammaproteobacteria bacterium]MBV9696571.1 hypothetical protein [Gammaproteobacteria bacterium]